MVSTADCDEVDAMHVYSSYLFRSVESNHYDDATFAPQVVERVNVYDPYCPVHGSRRRLPGKRLVDMRNIVSSLDEVDEAQLSPILYR